MNWWLRVRQLIARRGPESGLTTADSSIIAAAVIATETSGAATVTTTGFYVCEFERRS